MDDYWKYMAIDSKSAVGSLVNMLMENAYNGDVKCTWSGGQHLVGGRNIHQKTRLSAGWSMSVWLHTLQSQWVVVHPLHILVLLQVVSSHSRNIYHTPDNKQLRSDLIHPPWWDQDLWGILVRLFINVQETPNYPQNGVARELRKTYSLDIPRSARKMNTAYHINTFNKFPNTTFTIS